MLKRVLALPGQIGLQKREHHFGRWHRDGRGAGARQYVARPLPAWEGCDVVEDGKALPHELASRATLSTGVTSE